MQRTVQSHTNSSRSHFFRYFAPKKAALAPPIAAPIDLTLPSLLDAACDRALNPQALNHWTGLSWQAISNHAFRDQCEAAARGLVSLGLQKGDRVAFLLHNDVSFAIADMSCLMAGLVDVPIDLTQTLENIIFILNHSKAKVLWIADLDLLQQVAAYLDRVPTLQRIIISSAVDCPTPSALPIMALGELQALGQAKAETLRSSPQDLATLIYIPAETGELVGVMLTHQNLAGNAIAAFTSLSGLKWGAEETILSFLPLTHVFARCLLYGHLYYGHSIYFSSPKQVLKHLKQVQPTIVAVVPLFLEKLYSKLLERGNQARSKVEKRLFSWTLGLMQRYELGRPPDQREAALLRLVNRLVLSHWRSLFGNRIKYVLSGGATLKAELANGFAAAGIAVLQGYGLTQAGIVCFNRAETNRAGTVGEPIAGVEVAIAADQEILVRSSGVSPGYYKNPAVTDALVDAQGWLHTGDLGRFTAAGLLQITGVKKALFKLSTGKYIAPQPIEARLAESLLVERAIVVGAERKHCAALIMPNWAALRDRAQALSLPLTDEALCQHPCILMLYQAIVDAANCHLPYWTIVKQFRLIQSLPADGDRASLTSELAPEIEALYQVKALPAADRHIQESCPIPAAACSSFAQSLNPRFTA